MTWAGRPTMDDPLLGPVLFCGPCDEWWPDDVEFWGPDGHGYKRCRACYREQNSAAWRATRDQRRRGLCQRRRCPVRTPRRYCYYHARTLG